MRGKNRSLALVWCLLIALTAPSVARAGAPPCPPEGWAAGASADGAIRAWGTFNGELVAGGHFGVFAGVPANRIARLDTATDTWSALGTGITAPASASVNALCEYNASLYAGGSFTAAGGVAAARIARWNGVSWATLGNGVSGSSLGPVPAVHALTTFAGNLIVGGDFTTIGITANAKGIGQWNGSAWSRLGSGFDGIVYALVEFNGELIAGGSFFNSGTTPCRKIARWNGTAWQPMGAGLGNDVMTLTVADGQLIAGGFAGLIPGTATVTNLARWTGSAWEPVTTPGLSPAGPVAAAVGFENSVAAVGAFDCADAAGPLCDGGVVVNSVGRYDGLRWYPFAAGPGFTPNAAIVFNHRLIVGGGYNVTLGSPGPSGPWSVWTDDNTPVVVSGADGPGTIAQGDSLTVTARLGDDLVDIAAQWFKDGLPVSNGPQGASPGGGTVSGASALFPLTRNNEATLEIVNAQPSDSGDYQLRLAGAACGQAQSSPATVIVTPAGGLSFFDIFLSTYYTQTIGGVAPSTPTRHDFIARLSFTEPDAVPGGAITVPGQGALNYNTIRTFTASYFGPDMASQAALLAAFPAGTYTHTIAGGALDGQSASLARPAAPLWTTTVPFFSTATFSGLQVFDAAQDFLFEFESWTPVAGANISVTFLVIFDASTGIPVFTDVFPSSTDTYLLPANTLLPGTAYQATLYFSSRDEGTSPGFGGAVSIVGFDLVTSAPLTTRPLCVADFNGDTALNDDDLGEFITSYFELFPGPGGYAVTPCDGADAPFDTLGFRADITGDCSVNDDDLGLYITLFFIGCE